MSFDLFFGKKVESLTFIINVWNRPPPVWAKERQNCLSALARRTLTHNRTHTLKKWSSQEKQRMDFSHITDMTETQIICRKRWWNSFSRILQKIRTLCLLLLSFFVDADVFLHSALIVSDGPQHSLLVQPGVGIIELCTLRVRLTFPRGSNNSRSHFTL